MGYEFFRYARHIDADSIGIYHSDLTKMLKIDKGTAGVILIEGSLATGGDLSLKANETDNYPFFRLYGNDDAHFRVASGKAFRIYDEANPLIIMERGGAVGQGGCIKMKECTTPTATADYGAIYTKSDNNLYFQDGAGNEHTVTIV